jgi:hypothetical protein
MKISPEKKKEYNKNYRLKRKQQESRIEELEDSDEKTLEVKEEVKKEVKEVKQEKTAETTPVESDAEQSEDVLVISKRDFYQYISKVKQDAVNKIQAKPLPQPEEQPKPKPQQGEAQGESLMTTIQKTLVSTLVSSAGSLMIPLSFYAIGSLLKTSSKVPEEPQTQSQPQQETSIQVSQIPTQNLY